jgi:hypothetical protein
MPTKPPNGCNPMRWDCERNGCFNKLRRPKIEMFAECFPGRINFGDVDGIVEMRGKFCLLEWKGDGGALRLGQQLTYNAFTKEEGNTVLVVHGDAETMEVNAFSYFWKGVQSTPKDATMDDVKAFVVRWVGYVTSKEAAA